MVILNWFGLLGMLTDVNLVFCKCVNVGIQSDGWKIILVCFHCKLYCVGTNCTGISLCMEAILYSV